MLSAEKASGAHRASSDPDYRRSELHLEFRSHQLDSMQKHLNQAERGAPRSVLGELSRVPLAWHRSSSSRQSSPFPSMSGLQPVYLPLTGCPLRNEEIEQR